jgi:hypothetical protein
MSDSDVVPCAVAFDAGSDSLITPFKVDDGKAAVVANEDPSTQDRDPEWLGLIMTVHQHGRLHERLRELGVLR